MIREDCARNDSTLCPSLRDDMITTAGAISDNSDIPSKRPMNLSRHTGKESKLRIPCASFESIVVHGVAVPENESRNEEWGAELMLLSPVSGKKSTKMAKT